MLMTKDDVASARSICLARIMNENRILFSKPQELGASPKPSCVNGKRVFYSCVVGYSSAYKEAVGPILPDSF